MTVFTPRYSRKPAGKQTWFQRLRGRFSLGSNRGRPMVAGVRTGQASVTKGRGMRHLTRAFLLLTVAVLAAGGIGRLGYGLLARSDIFRLTEVSVQGNRVVDDARLINLAGLRPGINLLTLDRQAALTGIRNLPWVRDAEIHINWPSRAEIRIQEYHPLALVATTGQDSQGLSYVDRDGTVFAPVDPGQDVDYPVLTGDLARMGLENGRIRPGSPAAAALKFLRLAGRSNAVLPAQAISEVNLDPARGLIVYLVDRPFPIYLGRERIRTRYWRLVKILDRLYRKKKIEQIREIRMDYDENRALVAMLPSGD